LDRATFAAVRGELTKKTLKLDSTIPVGDFGLLADRLLNKKGAVTVKKYQVGFVPHYVDYYNPWFANMANQLKNECCIIDVQNKPESVISQISNCHVIVSSSLHGIIVADSLNIPNIWIQLSDKVIGDGFKFYDYNSAIDYEQHRIQINSEDQKLKINSLASNKSFNVIENKKKELEKIMTDLLRGLIRDK
jgi:pyruvyltransferase